MTLKISTPLRALAVMTVLGLVMLVGAPGASAAPKLDIGTSGEGVKDGQKIVVKGSGFAPNVKNVGVGQCKEKQKGPADCNTAGGATIVNADANGNIPDTTLTLSKVFGEGIDCTKQTCVVAVAPLPTTNSADVVAANSVAIKLTFGSPVAQATAAATTPAPTAAPAATNTNDASALPKTGPTDSLPVMLLIAGAFVLTGVGLLIAMPSRRSRRAGA